MEASTDMAVLGGHPMAHNPAHGFGSGFGGGAMVFAPHGQQPFEGMAAPMMAGNPSEQWSPCPLSVRLEPSACPHIIGQQSPIPVPTPSPTGHEAGNTNPCASLFALPAGLASQPPPTSAAFAFADGFGAGGTSPSSSMAAIGSKRVSPDLDASLDPADGTAVTSNGSAKGTANGKSNGTHEAGSDPGVTEALAALHIKNESDGNDAEPTEEKGGGGGITFLVSMKRDEREPARIRTVHELSGGVGAVSRELSASLGLPPSTTFLYFSDEFDEFVAMEDVTTLPKKCRVRPVLDATDEFE